jgi:hypothetical protein
MLFCFIRVHVNCGVPLTVFTVGVYCVHTLMPCGFLLSFLWYGSSGRFHARGTSDSVFSSGFVFFIHHNPAHFVIDRCSSTALVNMSHRCYHREYQTVTAFTPSHPFGVSSYKRRSTIRLMPYGWYYQGMKNVLNVEVSASFFYCLVVVGVGGIVLNMCCCF